MKKNNAFFLLALASAGLLMLGGRAFETLATDAEAAEVRKKIPKLLQGLIMGQPRGIRQNNAGNIRPNKNYTWNGASGESGGYLIFSDMRYGIRAMVKILRNYNALHGINTVKGIIYRWAPPSDNNPTDAYVKHVAQALGVGINDEINVNDYMPNLIKVISKHENGGDYLTPLQIAEGIAWA